MQVNPGLGWYISCVKINILLTNSLTDSFHNRSWKNLVCLEYLLEMAVDVFLIQLGIFFYQVSCLFKESLLPLRAVHVLLPNCVRLIPLPPSTLRQTTCQADKI